MDSVFFILEIIGTVAFSVSGALVAISKKMDLLGVVALGLITAVGGGIIRDITLGITPPNAFKDPVFCLISIATSIVVFLPPVLKSISKNKKVYDTIWFVFDTVGLATFTVSGINVANGISTEYNLYLLIFTGVITGVGGGVLRDVLSGQLPFIFVKHFYACASIIGALICSVLYDIVGAEISMISGGVSVVVLRILAAKYLWSLPKPVLIENADPKIE